MNNCPLCSHELVNIFYGNPSFALIEMAKSEDVCLGGTSTDPDRPTLYCYGCHETF